MKRWLEECRGIWDCSILMGLILYCAYRGFGEPSSRSDWEDWAPICIMAVVTTAAIAIIKAINRVVLRLEELRGIQRQSGSGDPSTSQVVPPTP